MRTGLQTPDGQSGDTLSFCGWFTTRHEAKSVAVMKEWHARFAAQPRASWKRDNAERYRLFEGPRNPELTEDQ